MHVLSNVQNQVKHTRLALYDVRYATTFRCSHVDWRLAFCDCNHFRYGLIAPENERQSKQWAMTGQENTKTSFSIASIHGTTDSAANRV